MSRSGTELKRICEEILPALKTMLEVLRADSVMVRGNSGLSVAYVLHVLAPELRFIVARKPHEQRNSHGRMFEPMSDECINVESYIVLDDTICTGDTLKKIHKDVNDECRDAPIMVGVMLYGGAGPFVRHRLAAAISYDPVHDTDYMVPVWIRERPY